MKFTLNLVFILCVALVVGCTHQENHQSIAGLTAGEGFVEVEGGKIWYRVVGSGDKTPIILLHGGPGFTSYYLNPLAPLGKDRPVIYFDQLGCGRSEAQVDTTMMTISHHIAQVEALRQALDIESFYLYGQSWGTMFGVDYYFEHPEAVRAMILSSPALSVPMWEADADTLISYLPDSIQLAIGKHEEAGTFDSPEYQSAINVFYHNFVARKMPWSTDMDSTFQTANLDVYGYMWGPSEFTATGTLRNFDRTDRLGDIKVPTLFITGEFDEARPSTVAYYQSLVPGAEFEVIEGAAHITMHDNPEKDIAVISAFLEKIESNSK